MATQDVQYAAAFFSLTIGTSTALTNFTELSGLDAEVEAIEHRTTNMEKQGLNTIRKVPGTWKFSDVTIKRAIDDQGVLFEWVQQWADGEGTPALATITMYDNAGTEIAAFTLQNAWPKKYTPAGFNAKDNAIAVEEIVLAHEGFFRDGVAAGRHAPA